MANSCNVIVLASALCFLTFLTAASADDRFFVEGKVYCDTCRTQFVTRISENLAGAKVRLECRDREDGTIKYSVEGSTDETGTYHLPVDGDHENEVCEIDLVKSSKPECEQKSNDAFLKKTARISLTKKNGMASNVRMANPLGFMPEKPHADCVQVMKELGMTNFNRF